MAKICSELPEELVSMVAERVVCFDDLIRFGGVCKTWRSASILEKQNKKKVYAPMIMLAKAENDNNDGEGVRSFVIPYYRDGNKKMRSFNVELAKAQGRKCWGSPYGWVVTVGLDLNIGLLNPLTGAHLPLPSQPIPQERSLFSKELSICMSKFVLGWHQASQSWLVMAIFGRGEKVGFTFAGIENQNEAASSSSSWTFIDDVYKSKDSILFKDRIFMISHYGLQIASDIKQETPPKANDIGSLPEDLDFTDISDWTNRSYYLVERDQNLLLVVRYFNSIYHDEPNAHPNTLRSIKCDVTTHFLVWKFNFFIRSWHKLDDLGEYALFLGNNTSFAISTTTYPHISKNCVYFADDHYTGLHTQYDYQFCDMGVYDVGERTVRPFDIANIGVFSDFSRPTFFMPTL